MRTKHPAEWLPVIALLLSASFWGCAWLPMRWFSEHGLDGVSASLLLFGVALCIGLPWLWQGRAELIRHPSLLLALAVASGWCNISFMLALLEGTVVRVILLFYLSPVWAVILARMILHEQLPRVALLTLGIAMSGALVILWDTSLGKPWPRDSADWLAISSGLSFALSNVLIRKGADISERIRISVSWAGVVGVALLMLSLYPSTSATWSSEVIAVGVIIGLGGIALMTSLLVYGVSRMPVHRSAVILLFEIVVGAVTAQWLAGEVLGIREWVGGFLIMIAAWIAARQQNIVSAQS